ncbi:MAG: phytanoyl-CoA dioxygenase family protein [Pseudomonadota bacterium]
MTAKVTQAHIDQYHRDGCVKIESVFDSYWVDMVTRGIDRIIKTYETGNQPEQVTHEGCQAPFFIDGENGTYRILHVAAYSAEIQKWIRESPAAEVLADVMGTDTLRYWLDGTFAKAGTAADTATPWHNDECTYPLSGVHSASLWMALTDVAEDNAPLLTLQGSNNDTYRYHSGFSPQDVERPPEFRPWSELVDRVNAPDAPIQSWPAKAGDILVIHPKTIHGSAPRTGSGGGRRLAFSSRWIGDDIRYAPNPLSLNLALKDGGTEPIVGEPLPEDSFPITWRRTVRQAA